MTLEEKSAESNWGEKRFLFIHFLWLLEWWWPSFIYEGGEPKDQADVLGIAEPKHRNNLSFWCLWAVELANPGSRYRSIPIAWDHMSSLFKPEKLGYPLDESTSKFKKSPSIILVKIFAQISTLSYINIATPALFWLLFVWCIFSKYFIIFISIKTMPSVKWLSWKIQLKWIFKKNIYLFGCALLWHVNS